jgi:hypothetical protein
MQSQMGFLHSGDRQSMLLVVDRWLLRSAGVLLAVIGLIKIVSAFSGVAYLAETDPVISFLTNKLLLVFVGILETFLAAVILLLPQTFYARFGLLAMCATFVVYRVGLSMFPEKPLCPCLGRASDWLHLTRPQAESVALGLLLVLSLIGLVSVAFYKSVQLEMRSVSNRKQ